MATVEAHKRPIIDVKISFSLSEKPSADLYENVRSFITRRGTKSIFPCASDISTQAGITILLRTVNFQVKGTVASTLRNHFSNDLSSGLVSEISVVDCNDFEKESLDKSEDPLNTGAPVLRGWTRHAQVTNKTNQSWRGRISAAVPRKMAALLRKLSWRARISAAAVYRSQLVAVHYHNHFCHVQS